jgi:hypothetical protein
MISSSSPISPSVISSAVRAPNSLVALHCSACHDPFNAIRRRHFCRACIRPFCGKCSNRRIAKQNTDHHDNQSSVNSLVTLIPLSIRCCDECYLHHIQRYGSSGLEEIKRLAFGQKEESVIQNILETSGVNQLFSAVGALFSSSSTGSGVRSLPPSDLQLESQRSTLFKLGSDAERHFFSSKELATAIWRDFIRVSRAERLRVHLADLTVHTGQRKNIDVVSDYDLDSAFLMLQAAFYRNFAKLTVTTENAAAAPLPFNTSGSGVSAALAVAAAVTSPSSQLPVQNHLLSPPKTGNSGLSSHVKLGSAVAAIVSPRNQSSINTNHLTIRSPLSPATSSLTPTKAARLVNAPEPPPQAAPPPPALS